MEVDGTWKKFKLNFQKSGEIATNRKPEFGVCATGRGHRSVMSGLGDVITEI